MNNSFLAHCESAEYAYWEVKDYIVEYSGSPLTNTGEYQCTCKAFQYGKTRPCKHIKELIKLHRHCAWTGELVELVDGNRCPKCKSSTGIHKRIA